MEVIVEHSVSLKRIFKINYGVKTREENFGLLVVSKNTPALSLNEDSAAVLKLCNGTHTVENIIKIISEDYHNDSINNKVIETLEGFLKLGLIKQIN